MFSQLIAILVISYGYGIIMPITKPDGNIDISSLLSHIALLEHTVETRASAAALTKLESQLQATQGKLNEAEMKIAVLESQSKSSNAHCSCNKTSSLDTQSTADLNKLKSDISHMEGALFNLVSIHNITATFGGITYTRWGRTVCPVGQTVMYKGYVAGSHDANWASSATVLCLPEHPLYAEHTPTGHDSYVYGSEYETKSYPKINHWSSLADEGVPCVVCHSDSHQSAVMVPGRNQCYPGWNLEYWGYLMGPKTNVSSSDIICVDKDPESVPGSASDMDGHSLFMVEGACGSLPCPPYENYWELTCAVCTR